MVLLVREFFWIIFPIFGMGIGALAVWGEFSRQKRALDVLKIYAEKGTEPPASVLAVLNRAGTSGGRGRGNPWSRMVFFLVLSIGFGALAFFSAHGDPSKGAAFLSGFGIISFAMFALAASALVSGLTSNRANDR